MSQESSHKFKRINVLVRSDQYEKVNEVGLNMSGLIRGLLDDHFGDQRIVFSVSPRVKEVYQRMISNFGAENREIEAHFLEALDRYLEKKTHEIETLRQSIKED